ncbi:MAG: transpeptidase family protein [Bacteroidaceae bacterium]|nr:transpeptidase family protein [Bacteroidaceae bacterium]
MKFDSKNAIPRYMVVVLTITLLGLVILYKAVHDMITESDYWSHVQERLEKRQKTLNAVRGNIYSSDGELLVGSIPIYTLHIDFAVIDKDHPVQAAKAQFKRDSTFIADLDSLCMGLHEIFPDESENEFREVLMNGFQPDKNDPDKRGRNCEFRRNVSYIDYKRCCELPYLRLPVVKSGFYSSHIMRRLRPFGNMANKTLGIMDRDGNALDGLELAYDSILRGTDGRQHLVRKRAEWTYQVDVAPVDGLDIVSTIDVRMQDAAEKALRRQLINRPNTEIGMIVLMEAATGDVKAMASITRRADGSLEEVRNNVISDAWEPGSTFKTASVMVGIEDGYLNRSSGVHVGNGVMTLHGGRMADHNAGSGGYRCFLDLAGIMMYSSNIGISVLIDNAYSKDPEKFFDGLNREGMGIDLQLPFREARPPSMKRPSLDPRNRNALTLPWASIGYGNMLPPISTVAYYNAIANNGRMMKPRFVKAIMKDGQVVKELPPVVMKEQICSPATLAMVRELLDSVVNEKHGLGKRARGDGFSVSGKTGTAKIAAGRLGYKYSPMRYLLSFCGYYPTEAPKYSCIVCFVQRGAPASGGLVSGPVFKEVADYVMNTGVYRGIDEAADSAAVMKPTVLSGEYTSTASVMSQLDVSNPETNLQRIDTIQCDKVPNVVGMGARDAVVLMERCGLMVQLHGSGSVSSQSIPAGSTVTRGQQVVLTLRTPH